MSKAIPKECMALLKEASEMFSETGCVPGIDGEEVPAETIVPDAKEYISETIDDPEAIYDPEIWDTSGLRTNDQTCYRPGAVFLHVCVRHWHRDRCRKLAHLKRAASAGRLNAVVTKPAPNFTRPDPGLVRR